MGNWFLIRAICTPLPGRELGNAMPRVPIMWLKGFLKGSSKKPVIRLYFDSLGRECPELRSEDSIF